MVVDSLLGRVGGEEAVMAAKTEIPQEELDILMKALANKPRLIELCLANVKIELERLESLGLSTDEVAIKLGMRKKRKSPQRNKKQATLPNVA